MAVLIGLANHAHPNGHGAFPSQERLAHYSRKSTRSIRSDLATLERLGLIRRGDQRHTAFIPSDRRPVVWDLALERRREVPSSLDPFAEPLSGRPTEVPEPVDNRAEASFRAVADRAEAQRTTAGSLLPRGRKLASYKPSFNHQEPNEGAAASEGVGRSSASARNPIDSPKDQPQSSARRGWTPPKGAALPPNVGDARCPKPGHVGQPIGSCAVCRSEALGGAA
ncbi:helix-turn-helix domain-containing protein [Actinoplanes sp. CA-142083]|uniref:helix-turn-helix domain-containing protein n=1 Tax=Actinoplanes sp. CA-142083 TaxID=3239903 RepID=UPI003D8CB1CB